MEKVKIGYSSEQRVALLSVYDKKGIVEFAQGLLELGYTILASGGTAKCLEDAGMTVYDVAGLVGGGAMLGHRVVTLSREVHAGLLATHSPEDIAEMAGLDIPFIDLVCVDLYPLIEEINREGCTTKSVIEKTDIGGPTMLRSAAKGQRIVVCDPIDRMQVLEWMRNGYQDFSKVVTELAAKAEFVISKYCLASAKYHSNGRYQGFLGELVQECKYGENAYQAPAGLYSNGSDDPLALHNFKLIDGDAASYNNWADVDRLLQTLTRIAATFDTNYNLPYSIAVGVKHGNACGAGISNSPAIGTTEALSKMIDGDPLALFGGLVMVNFPVDVTEAETLFSYGMPTGQRRILDGIVAPFFTDEAITHLRRKNGKCRFIANKSLLYLNRDSLDTAPRFRNVRGGFLLQPNYTFVPELNKMAALGKAGDQSEQDMLLAIAICHTSNSNTITLCKNGMLIGNGVSQQSRVAAANLAVTRAKASGHDIFNASAASDSFFPFTDGVEELANAGISTLFATSGSVRDNDIIKVCADYKIILYFGSDKICRGFFGH